MSETLGKYTLPKAQELEIRKPRKEGLNLTNLYINLAAYVITGDAGYLVSGTVDLLEAAAKPITVDQAPLREP